MFMVCLLKPSDHSSSPSQVCSQASPAPQGTHWQGQQGKVTPDTTGGSQRLSWLRKDY